MSLKITLLDYNSIDKVLGFFNSAQSDRVQSNNRRRNEFEWLFFNGLFKPALYAVATDEDTSEIVGTFAGIFIPVISKNGEEIISVKGEDTLISLDRSIKFDTRDILKELVGKVAYEAKKNEKVRFMWGFTPVKNALKRCGFSVITQIRGSFYVIQPLKFYKNRIKLFPHLSMLKKIQIFLFSFYNCFTNKLHSPGSDEIKVKNISFNEIDESLALSFLPRNVFATILNKEFIRWRIVDNPYSNVYGCLEFRNINNEVISYFIYSYNSDQIYFVEQILFRDNLVEKMKLAIIRMACNFFKREKAIMIRASGFPHNHVNLQEIELLKKSGFYFFNNPEESYVVFYNLSDSEIDPHDIYFSRLNMQGIR